MKRSVPCDSPSSYHCAFCCKYYWYGQQSKINFHSFINTNIDQSKTKTNYYFVLVLSRTIVESRRKLPPASYLNVPALWWSPRPRRFYTTNKRHYFKLFFLTIGVHTHIELFSCIVTNNNDINTKWGINICFS